MNQGEVLGILAGFGAVVQNNHFVLASGKHSKEYVNKDAIYPHTRMLTRLCGEMGSWFVYDEIETVIGPAVGGVILAQRVADYLTDQYGRQVYAVYADKEGGDFVIKRGYDKLLKGKRTLLVEDILTTGGSVLKVIDVARAAGAHIQGVSALCNRGEVTAAGLQVSRLEALVSLRIQTWEPHECPMCEAGIPVNIELGKGKEFLAAHSH